MNFSPDIFDIQTPQEFEYWALKTYAFQFEQNLIYRAYSKHLGKSPESIDSVEQIPFLPISFFKTQAIRSFQSEADIVFSSSGTTGAATSNHMVRDVSIYEKSFTKCFESFYGSIGDFCVLALLPAYLEREGSSLVYMAHKMIEKSGFGQSGFYLNNIDDLVTVLQENEKKKISTLLLGVSFALLDLCEKYDLKLRHTIVMETGGMKGRRKEITREELHHTIKVNLGVMQVHSEYGMTELLSQAYAKKNGIYQTPPWMKIMIRDVTDPFSYQEKDKIGGVNIIDLANYWSCSFIETEDLGRKNEHGFEILGRFDQSQLRGCNLLIG